MKGYNPTKRSKKDFSFHKTFGTVTIFPAEYTVDAGLTMPNQNAEGLVYGCTAESATDLATDEDAILYDAKKHFEIARQMAGLPADITGMDMRQAFDPVYKIGLYPLNETEPHKKNYFWLEKNGDWFNSLRSCLFINRLEKRSVAIGTSWYAEFELVDSNGILNENPTNKTGGHAYKIDGWVQKNSRGEWIRNGEVFLRAKTWQGPDYGDKGFVYISQKLIDKLMSEWGSQGVTLKNFTGDIVPVKIELIQQIIDFIRQIISKFGCNTSAGVISWAKGIKEHEGWMVGSRSYRNNSPGNFRWTPYIKSLGATDKDKDNFAIFPTPEAGFNALLEFLNDARANLLIPYRNYAKSRNRPNNMCTLGDFFQVFAPISDKNSPNIYALKVAKFIGNGTTVDVPINRI